MLEERQIDADGLSLNVAVGPRHGPPLVLLHGVARRWQDYVALIPTLAARWWVIAPDFRGHGRSARAEGYRVVDYVRDALAVLDHFAEEPAVVFGHSLGAMVAAAVAAERPDRVRAAILEDPPFDTLGAGIRRTSFYSVFAAFRELAGPGRTVEELVEALSNVTIQTPSKTLRLRLSDLRDAAALRFMARSLVDMDPETMAPLVEGRWLDEYDGPAVLRRVVCPALLLQGEVTAGGMLDDEAAARVASQLPRATHVRVAGAGHLIHTMQPETTLRLVTSFLESL